MDKSPPRQPPRITPPECCEKTLDARSRLQQRLYPHPRVPGFLAATSRPWFGGCIEGWEGPAEAKFSSANLYSKQRVSKAGKEEKAQFWGLLLAVPRTAKLHCHCGPTGAKAVLAD